jgi:hypothetical protein
MRQEPKNGLDVRMPYVLPLQGRVRPEEILRRKLMQKMMARRERHVLAATTTVRRAV